MLSGGFPEAKPRFQIKGSINNMYSVTANARALNIYNPGCESQIFNGRGGLCRKFIKIFFL